MQKHRLVAADIGRQRLEAIGLTRLTLQAFDLAFELRGDVVEPFEIGFSRAQTQFRLMATGMQAGNAGRLFEQLATRLGLGLNEFADPALPHHGWGAGAGGGVGEKQLHILGTRFLAVDAVDRTVLALDATRDLDLVLVVEGSRSRTVGIVEIEADFGGVARRAVAGTGEDDVVHAGRTHVLVGVFPHHPAQRLDKVRLAAAIGTDHAGEAALDDEFGGFDEGLEAEKAELVELHAAALGVRCPLRKQRPSPACRRAVLPPRPACGEKVPAEG